MYVFILLNVFVQEAFPNTISPTLLLATTSLTSGATGLKTRFVKKILRILMKDCFLILNLVQIAWHCLDDKDAPAYPDLMQVEINIINNVLLSFIIYFIINILYLIMVIIITTIMLQGEMDFINSVCPCAGLSMLNRVKEGNVSHFDFSFVLLIGKISFCLFATFISFQITFTFPVRPRC